MEFGFRHAVRAALILLGLCIAAQVPAAHAATLPVSGCIARATPGMTASALFGPHAVFDCTTPQTRFGPGDYWVRSTPIRWNGQRDEGLRVRVNSLWQDAITLYVRYPDGHVWSQRLGQHGITRHIQLGALIEWRPPPGRPVQLLWHVEGSANLRGVITGPVILGHNEGAASNLRLAAMYAGFSGLCVALLIYNLAMYGALRHRFQIAYCGMVVALMGYAFTSSGALAWADPTILNNDRLRLNYLFLAAAAITALNFARCFFEDVVCEGWVGRTVTACSALMAASTIAFCLFAPWQIRVLDTAYSLSFLALMGAVVPIVARARRQSSKHLWLFAVAWAVPVGFAALRLLSNMALVPWSFWLDNSTILSMSFEAVMSSLAIAYRIRLLLVERDEARANEIAARVLADSDPLTGLLNRRAFMAEAIGREGRQTLLIVDIDHFKRVNETLGHDGGDEVLRVFARVLRMMVPPGGLVARMGGEEFAMLVDERAAAINTEQVLAGLRTARMPFDLAVTASIGACTGPLASESDWKLLYRSADRALFAAKAAGRDRARAADPIAAAA